MNTIVYPFSGRICRDYGGGLSGNKLRLLVLCPRWTALIGVYVVWGAFEPT